MEKRNVVEDKRTPDHEIKRTDEDWDKTAAKAFIPPVICPLIAEIQKKDKHV